MSRNCQGYGAAGPNITWPNQARCVVNFVINYEEGAERSPVNHDRFAETYGGEFPLSPRQAGIRHLSMESLYEYGSRTGIWRLIRLFDGRQVPVTFFVTGFALLQNPEFATFLSHCPHDIAGHGWRWLDYHDMSVEQEQEHIHKCLQAIRTLTGKQATGWYTGRQSIHTRQLVAQCSDVLYCSDSYADDWPYEEQGLLMLPYSLDCNDFRYSTSPGWSCGADFLSHLIDSFDYLYQENKGAIMTIGLHPRFSGHPGRCAVIAKFLDHLQSYPDIWLAHRHDIAKYWLQQSNI